MSRRDPLSLVSKIPRYLLDGFSLTHEIKVIMPTSPEVDELISTLFGLRGIRLSQQSDKIGSFHRESLQTLTQALHDSVKFAAVFVNVVIPFAPTEMSALFA